MVKDITGLPEPDSDFDFLVEELASDADDAFGYREIAATLGRTLSRASPPFVYGICGPWGSGKSSLLRYLVRYLPSKETGSFGIHFNAWRSTLHSDLRLAFVVSVLGQLRVAIKDSKWQDKERKWKKSLKKTLRRLEAIHDVALEALKDQKGFVGFLGKTAYLYNKHLEGQPDVALDSELEHHRELVWLGSDLRKKGLSCFVLIDELDRCSPGDVVRVLEAIRVFFFGSDKLEEEVAKKYGRRREHAKSPFRFILAVEERYVVDAFSSYYKIDESRAARYLDKFIQFRFHFPAKEWSAFVGKCRKKHGRKKWFPCKNGRLPEVLTAFKVVDPRTAGRALAYLFFWQERLYPNIGKEGASLKVFLKERLGEYHEVGAGPALAAINEALTAWGAAKVVFPDYADRIVGGQIVERLANDGENTWISEGLFGTSEEEEVRKRWGNRAPVVLENLRRAQEEVSNGIAGHELGVVAEESVRKSVATVLEAIFKN